MLSLLGLTRLIGGAQLSPLSFVSILCSRALAGSARSMLWSYPAAEAAFAAGSRWRTCVAVCTTAFPTGRPPNRQIRLLPDLAIPPAMDCRWL